jgi:hypothetical protein
MHEHTSGLEEDHAGPRRREDELVALEGRLCTAGKITLLQDCGNEVRLAADCWLAWASKTSGQPMRDSVPREVLWIGPQRHARRKLQ